jgi:hypothetical protein
MVASPDEMASPRPMNAKGTDFEYDAGPNRVQQFHRVEFLHPRTF